MKKSFMVATIVARCEACAARKSSQDHTRLLMSVTSSCLRPNVIDWPETAKMRNSKSELKEKFKLAFDV